MTRPVALFILALICAALPARAERITVAVAANFLTTARDISAAFSAETGHEVALVHGSTGKLYSQIIAGAPFDLFLAADVDRPARLLAQNRATDTRTYAIGHLALVHTARTEPGELEQLLARDSLRLAIADPAVAPYGLAAQQVLETYKGADWRDNVVIGESVGQAFAFVATGNADAGFVGLAQALSYEGELWVLQVPSALHTAIRQDAALLARAADNQAARAFYDFLGGELTRQILHAAGYEAGP